MALDEQVSSEQGVVRPTIEDTPPPIGGIGAALPLKYSAEHLTGGEYGQWAQDISYFTDEGLRVCMVGAIPGNTVGSTSPTHEVVRIGKPLTLIIVTGTAERSQAPPKIPAWDVGNPNIICETHRVQVSTPHQMMNNIIVYRISWEYRYRCLKPFTASTYMPAGATPVDVGTSSNRYVNPNVQLDQALNSMSWLSL